MVEIVWVGTLMMTLGSVLVLVAGVGLLRLPDLYMRMSATTKAATLGLGLILIGVAMVQGTWAVTGRVVATILFLVLTAPIAAHAIGQAAYFAGVPLWRGTRVDELSRQPEAGAQVLQEPAGLPGDGLATPAAVQGGSAPAR